MPMHPRDNTIHPASIPLMSGVSKLMNGYYCLKSLLAYILKKYTALVNERCMDFVANLVVILHIFACCKYC